MDSEKIWKESDWTEQARQLIEGLKQFPDDSKIILVLRHSHRDEPEALKGAQKLRLSLRNSAKIYLITDRSTYSIVLYGDVKKRLTIYMKDLKVLVGQAK